MLCPLGFGIVSDLSTGLTILVDSCKLPVRDSIPVLTICSYDIAHVLIASYRDS